MSNYKDRVVVTGIGIICANGKNVEEFWRNVTDNKSGIRLVSTIPMSGINTEYAGEIDGYNPDDHFAPKEAEKYDIAGQLSIIAAREAAQVAKYDLAASDPYRVGVILGTSLGGMRSGEQFHEQWVKEGIENADPSLLYNYVIHIPVDSVSHYMKLKGPKSVISNACAAGTNSIGYAADIIRSGKADAMFAGGVDPLCRLSMSGFNTLGALAPEPCAPFSKSNGLNIGEGAGVLLLERMDLALERGATILGEVLSYALSADAYHITAPDPAGAGGMRSMRRTLEKAALPETAVDYVNGHGTGTNANDSSEPIGVRTLFGHDVPVSSTKSMIGHMLGAAGASEGVISVLAINDSFIPATINFDHEADKFKELDFVRDTGRTKELDTVMSNSFAFGGNNASLLLGKFKQDREVPAVPAKKRALITGLGALAGNSANAEELFAKFQAGENTFSAIENFDTERYVSTHGAQIPEVPYRKLVNPALLRRMDDLGKQATAVTKMALDDAKLKIDSKNSERVGVLFATGTGPLKTVEAFNRTVILKGAEAAEALLFPNTVMNAAAGHICLNFKIKGPTTTITSGGTAGINALFYATQLIQYGDADAVIVVTGDEFNETMVAGHSRVPGYLTAGNSSKPFGAGLDGTVLGEACVAFVVESEESALARGAKVYGELKGFGLTSDSSGPARVSRKGEEWAKSFELAVQEAGLTFDQVDYVAASASGNRVFDTAEARALRQVIGNKAPVSAPKGYFGEALASSGMLGALSALYAIERNNIPQIPGVEQAFSEAEGLDLVIGSNRERAVQHALVSSFSFGGNYQSLVIGRYEK
ncbi:beta-ketoacyl-[acyl-carrier-protein] synthase family protein [Tumebacillus sp. ITR2]|uniref:Beta-ketoacyl-[acyl-carrier-protein] synthase family protein n=1 Tax=Tumebacillus amylolyticus TaxID=2801339 RepID=A0ABS1JA67_9BACL|nr:beta-ketoacyl-[acyl-carrier-protein] synthase family protein [Tumebacillus amylolyticus]MBL0387158.1 beta-ketoacyl-[acyl-carrier-protein] synthase family protein [Tumebacillus amylolyticus]